jgi:catechol 2,3-dioxygenase-like lactoylglutathione lyase family enzyme
MIDHIYLPVTDLKRSETFYGAMLGPLGKSERWHIKAQSGYPGLTGFGEPGIPGFWVKTSKTTCAELYVAFAAKNEAAVNKAYEAALANGGKDNGRQGCGRSGIPAITRPMCSIPTATMWRSATSPGFMNNVCAAARSEPARRHAGLVYPPSRILRGVALRCRRMPVVLLNSRIVGNPEVGQKRVGGSWPDW